MDCVDVYALEQQVGQKRRSGSAGVVIGLYPETDSKKHLLTVFLVQNLTHRCQFYHGSPVKFCQHMFLITN